MHEAMIDAEYEKRLDQLGERALIKAPDNFDPAKLQTKRPRKINAEDRANG